MTALISVMRDKVRPDRAKKDLDSASAATLSFPGFYSMEKSKRKNLWSQFCCSGVWMVFSVRDFKLFWSVLIMNF
jgi:hypothetical protein